MEHIPIDSNATKVDTNPKPMLSRKDTHGKKTVTSETVYDTTNKEVYVEMQTGRTRLLHNPKRTSVVVKKKIFMFAAHQWNPVLNTWYERGGYGWLFIITQ